MEPTRRFRLGQGTAATLTPRLSASGAEDVRVEPTLLHQGITCQCLSGATSGAAPSPEDMGGVTDRGKGGVLGSGLGGFL